MAHSLKLVDYERSLAGITDSPIAGTEYLDLTDGVAYCLVEIEYPIPKPRVEWRDPSHGDGRDVSYHKYENREVTITLQIFGTSEDDLSDNASALWEQLLQPNPILEWIADGWTDPLYFDLISPPISIDTPDWFETWIRENGKIHVMSNVVIELEAKPFLRGPEETVTLLDGDGSPNIYAVTGIVKDASNFKGDVPAPADIFIDLVGGTLWTDLILGQRLNYSDDFDPIQEPTAGTPVANTYRLNGDYREIDTLTNLVQNPSFETAGTGAPDLWANWVESTAGGTLADQAGAYPISYDGTHCVKMGGLSGYTAAVLSDTIAVDPTKAHYLSVYYKGTTGYAATSCVYVYFYNGAAYNGAKWVWNSTSQPTSWTEMATYLLPADFPAGTDGVKIQLDIRSNDYSPIGYVYWDLVTLAELDAVTIKATFPLDDHEGRYLPVTAVSFADTTTYDDVTMGALLQTTGGTPLTASIASQTVSTDDPHTEFVEVALLDERFPVLSIPSHKVSNLADKSAIDQVVRVSADVLNPEKFWIDYIGIVPIDRAYIEVRNWQENDYLILDGRSSRLALSSLDGTLDTAMVYDITNQRGECNFVADPNGVNMTILALTNGQYASPSMPKDDRVQAIVDVTMVYSPLYLIVPED